MADKINFEILEDGTISVKTDGISKENHVSADQLLAEIKKLAGGKCETKQRHGHQHQHNGHFHYHSH